MSKTQMKEGQIRQGHEQGRTDEEKTNKCETGAGRTNKGQMKL